MLFLGKYVIIFERFTSGDKLLRFRYGASTSLLFIKPLWYYSRQDLNKLLAWCVSNILENVAGLKGNQGRTDPHSRQLEKENFKYGICYEKHLFGNAGPS